MDGTATTPAVSVIMAVRNAALFLARAVESILTQTFADFELVMVDDGSTDNSREIADGYRGRDPRVRTFAQPRGGISSALNRAIAAARADLLAELDSDDMAVPDRLERQVAWMAANPGIAALGGSIIWIDPQDRKVGWSQYPTDPTLLRGMLPYGSPIAHPTVMMRKQVVTAVGGYRSAFNTAEDYDLWLRIADRADMANLVEPLTYYRLHMGMATSRYRERQAKLAEVAREIAKIRTAGQPDPIAQGKTMDETMRWLGIARWPEDDLGRARAG